MRDVNDDELVELVEFAIAHDAQMRFIEQMPLDADHSWSAASLVSREEILARLGERFTLTPLPDEARGSAPAESFLVDGGPATVGVIASVSAPFCAACDRVRLTADGMVRNCLFSMSESDLRAPLRAGAGDEELAEVVRGEQWRKWAGHHVGRADFVQPDRPMSSIGG
jgi:cyclic pyranopterin phosphate synthase